MSLHPHLRIFHEKTNEAGGSKPRRYLTRLKHESAPTKLPAISHGIEGLTRLPTGIAERKTDTCLWCAGCGKTLFAMEFLVRGATMYNEPGVFMSFEKQKRNSQQTLLLWGSIWIASSGTKSFGLSTFTLNGTKSNKVASTIWKVSLSGSISQLRALAPSVLCWIPWNHSFRGCPCSDFARGTAPPPGLLKKKRVTTIITAERGSNT